MKRALFACALGAALPSVALAQTPPAPSTVDEVIVTARRVAEPLQRTPVAVTALGPEQLQASLIQNVRDVTQSVPSRFRS